MLARIFVAAVAVNYPWELAQSPLYVQPGGGGAMVWHCGLASVGDGVMVLLIVVAGRLLLRRGDWFVRPDSWSYVVMLTAGLALSIGVEWAAVRGLGWWSYGSRMPLVPMLGIGITPVAQLLALPPLIARLAAMRSIRVSNVRR